MKKYFSFGLVCFSGLTLLASASCSPSDDQNIDKFSLKYYRDQYLQNVIFDNQINNFECQTQEGTFGLSQVLFHTDKTYKNTDIIIQRLSGGSQTTQNGVWIIPSFTLDLPTDATDIEQCIQQHSDSFEDPDSRYTINCEIGEHGSSNCVESFDDTSYTQNWEHTCNAVTVGNYFTVNGDGDPYQEQQFYVFALLVKNLVCLKNDEGITNYSVESVQWSKNYATFTNSFHSA